MNKDDFRGDVREVEGFFHGGVAATDHRYLLIAIEKTITGGAGRNAFTLKRFFRFKTKIHGRCARADDQGIAGIATGIAF